MTTLNCPCVAINSSRQLNIYDKYTKWVEDRYGIVENVLDCDIVVKQSELQSNYYIHFWANTLEKDMIALIHPLPAMS